MRLDRVLANLGYGSRQEIRRVIMAGRVRVGPAIVRDPGHAVTDPAAISLDGAGLEDVGRLIIALHKPLGVVCSHAPDEGRRIYDLLPTRWLARTPQVTSVGRLDKDTSGLLIVTDDMALVHAMTSPKRHVTKRYVATLDRAVTPEAIEQFASGTLVLRGEVSPCAEAVLESVGATTVSVILQEGRYHQVRRMFAACGFGVLTLHRTDFGPFALGDLEPGAWRRVRDSEGAGDRASAAPGPRSTVGTPRPETT